MVKLKLPRGIRDIDPETYEKFMYIFNIFVDLCKKYNFKLMEPATIELFNTLSLKSGPDIEKEIYVFKDKAGRQVGLRFDLTVGITRYVVTHPELPKPVKLAAFGVQWRYDEPQFGRYRSFYAWDAEIYGGDEKKGTIEILLFANDLFKNSGLKKYAFSLSDRRLIELLAIKYVPKDRVLDLLRLIDKYNKLSFDELINKISILIGDHDKAEELLTIVSKVKTSSKAQLIAEELGYEGALFEVYDLLISLGIPINVDLSIVRGLDYYDGIVFEAYDAKNINLGALAGGGYYSKLTSAFGAPELTALGIAGGVERLTLALSDVWTKEDISNQIYIAIASSNVLNYAYVITQKLRDLGYSVDIDLTNRHLRSQLEYANKMNFKYVIIIGEKERKENKITLRDMSRKIQKTITLNEISDYINS